MTTQTIYSAQQNIWDPLSPASWASALGMVYVPMFGRLREKTPGGDHAVLLDGVRASLAISAGNTDLVLDDAPLSWSWSANMRHTLVINESRNKVAIRHWDSHSFIDERPLPETRLDALRLLSHLEKYPNIRTPDVISRMLKAFRQIRSAIYPHTSAPTDTVLVFNAFLIGSEYARLGLLDAEKWRRSRTVGEALSLLNDSEYNRVGEITRSVSIGTILDTFVEPDPLTNYTLEPDLLVRHAAGVLFQDAHFELERESYQLSLPGLAPTDRGHGAAKRDARFTPPSLARAIVQQALDALGDLTPFRALSILDPACGSGVFLQESIRELSNRGFRGKLRLRGFDNSGVSCVITRFCIEQTARDVASEFVVDFDVEEKDALLAPWGKYDVVLINPPFMNWQRMSPAERDSVSLILGGRGSGHVDKAMAFVWRAVQSLNPAGVLGTIIPSPFLDSNAGRQWREAMLAEASLFLIGRFSGYGYFPGAAVEPAFLIMKNKRVPNAMQPMLTRVLLANEGFEDKSLRLLRIGENTTVDQGVQIREDDALTFTESSWRPRSQKLSNLLERLSHASLSRVVDLFDVHQGIITGLNDTFILDDNKLAQLPRSERKYFRSLAGSKTISYGQLLPGQHVFYPYGDARLEILDEEGLNKNVPAYYSKYLLPVKEALLKRRSMQERWWELTWERRWQWSVQPKLLSKYFGAAGSFVYDAKGTFVIGQGYAWLWKDRTQAPDNALHGGVDTEDELVEADEPLEPVTHLSPW